MQTTDTGGEELRIEHTLVPELLQDEKLQVKFFPFPRTGREKRDREDMKMQPNYRVIDADGHVDEKH